MNCDRDAVDHNDGFMEDAFHDEDQAPACPLGWDIDPATVASDALNVAQGGELGLPDSGGPYAMVAAAQAGAWTFKGEIPDAVETEF